MTDELSPADELELLRRRAADDEQRRNARMNDLLRADYRRTKGEQAGVLRPTRDEVEAKRAELIAAGLPHGLRPLARALNVSVGTVRRRLAK